MERRTIIGLGILGALAAAGALIMLNLDKIASAAADAVDYVGKYWTWPAAAAPFAPLIQQFASTYGIPVDLLARQIQAESQFKPDAQSNAGAEGIMQLEPQFYPGVDPFDPAQAIKAGAASMASYFKTYGTWAKALAAYNAGPGTLNKAIAAGGVLWLEHLPTAPENQEQTEAYVGKILWSVRVEPIPPGAILPNGTVQA